MQTDHHQNIFHQKTFPIVLVCDHINKAPNIGGLFRIADAFGIDKIIFCGHKNPLGRRMTKTSRATEKVVKFETYEESDTVVKDLKLKGYQIVCLEITTKSIPIETSIFDRRPIALIIGDENHGISPSILRLSDEEVHITMFGKNSSMNVVQATGIALFEITKHLQVIK